MIVVLRTSWAEHILVKCIVFWIIWWITTKASRIVLCIFLELLPISALPFWWWLSIVQVLEAERERRVVCYTHDFRPEDVEAVNNVLEGLSRRLVQVDATCETIEALLLERAC